MKQTDMTEGNPVKIIILFAIPLFLGNIFQQIYNIVDTMVAGYTLGDSAIAAIGTTATLYGFIINFAWGMNSGFGIIVSRAFGSGDREMIKKSIASMLVMDAVITILITVLSLIFAKPLLHAINVPSDIFGEAYSYIFVILAGMSATMLYNMCSGILRAVGNSQTPLWFLILSSILNLVLDFIFIVFLKFGVMGAAAATIVSEGISGILCGLYILKNYKEIMPSYTHFSFDPEFTKEMLSTGSAMAFMYCIVDFGSILYQRSINEMGSVLIVAHTAARKILSIFMMPLSSVASAYSTFVSQNYGAEKTQRIKSTLRKIMALEILFGSISCLLVFLFGEKAIVLLTNTTDGEVISNAYLSVRIHFLFFPVLGTLFVLRTSMQSMGEKIIPVVSSGFELVGKIVAGFVLIPAWGFICVCLTEPVIWTVCVLFMLVSFFIKKPLRQKCPNGV